MSRRPPIDFQQLRRAVLLGLRHGPLDQYALAKQIDQAEFAVRGELRALKRDRLVAEQLSRHGRLWRLTERGWEIVYGGDQTKLL